MQFRVRAREPLIGVFGGGPGHQIRRHHGDTRIAGPFSIRAMAEQAAAAFASDGCLWAWIDIEQADDPLDEFKQGQQDPTD